MDLFLLGAGHVGLVTAVGFARLGHRVTVADIDAHADRGLRARAARRSSSRGSTEAIADGLGEAAWRSPPSSIHPPTPPFTFVCVKTPTGPDGPLSMDHVEAAVERLLTRTGPDHTIVVRSTLPLDRARRRSPRCAAAVPTAPPIVTNPEFMREGSALRDFDRPGRVVAGWLEERDVAAAAGRPRPVCRHRRPDARRGRPFGGADQARLERVPRR